MKHLPFALVFVVGCTSGASSTDLTNADLSCDSSLTYASFGADFMSANCLTCHATRERPTLSTQADVQANLSRILDAAVYTTAMPEGADMSNDERKLLGDWLTCGAP